MEHFYDNADRFLMAVDCVIFGFRRGNLDLLLVRRDVEPDRGLWAVMGGFLKKEALTDETLKKIKALNEIATQRGQTLAEMALAWLLKDDMITSVIIGASSVAQLNDNLQSIKNTKFTAEELEKINQIDSLK